MNNTMEYRGYVGSVEFSEEDGLFYGKVMGIRALISYEGSTAAELVNDFHGAVDDYLASTHDKYHKELSKDALERVRGIFTDEPHRGAFQYESEQSGGKFH